MSEVWFTSDTHFGHTNVIKHSRRPFASIEEMDEALIANWNAVVYSCDTVYHLGDFAWRDALKYRNRLNGNICLIRGNHDAAADKIKHRFIWVKDVHMIKVGEQQIWLSHYAHRVWPKAHYGVWHLYGHSHGSLAEEGWSCSMDVGVDMAASVRQGLPEDYGPVTFDYVRHIMRGRHWSPVDHHTSVEEE